MRSISGRKIKERKEQRFNRFRVSVNGPQDPSTKFMIAFPNAKINFGLYITEKRTDGYHNVATVFYPIPLRDSLEILPQSDNKHLQKSTPKDIAKKIQQPLDGLGPQKAPEYVEGTDKRIQYSSSGIPISGSIKDNLCIKAYQLLGEDFPELPPIQMHLHKNIPSGAGMGGGSADASFTIQILNDLFDLGLSDLQKTGYAAQLGSDCAFFLLNRPALGTGRGEILEPISIDLTGYHLVIIHPGIHVPTAAAFSKILPKSMRIDELIRILAMPVPQWKDHLQNQFEPTVFEIYPEIRELKSALYNLGAIYASMTGSGSTVYGLFPQKAALQKLKLPAAYLHDQFEL